MGVVSHMILGGREIVKTTYMCSRDNNFQTSAICPLKCMLQSQFISCATGSKEYYYSKCGALITVWFKFGSYSI